MPYRVTADSIVSAVNEKQTATVGGSPTGGTYTLTVDASLMGLGFVPMTFNHNTNSTNGQSVANAALGGGQCTVTGSAGSLAFEFVGELAGTDLAMMAVTHALTGGSSPGVTMAETIKGVRGTLGWVAPTGALVILVTSAAGCFTYQNGGTQKKVAWDLVGEQGD